MYLLIGIGTVVHKGSDVFEAHEVYIHPGKKATTRSVAEENQGYGYSYGNDDYNKSRQ